MRVHQLLVLAIAVALAVPDGASADDCRTVQGRMILANGAPAVRIRVAATGRLLAVVQPHQAFDDLPANVRELWAADGDEAMWRSELEGTFRVCADGPDLPGRMRRVRLEGASRLRRIARP